MNRFAAATSVVLFTVLIFANSISAQSDTLYRLPPGTRIRLTLDAELSSKVASINDTFLATVATPVLVRDMVALPAGTLIEARIKSVKRASGFGRSGMMDVTFESMRFANASRPIDGVLIGRQPAAPSKVFNIGSILAGLAGGTAVGAASSSRGALIGAGIGAGVGAGIASARKGAEFRIKKGEEFEIELRKEVTLPVIDY